MKTTFGNDAAFGFSSPLGTVPGMSKREYFAAMALQAVMQNPSYLGALLTKYPEIKGMDASLLTGTVAVKYADALTEALNKEQTS